MKENKTQDSLQLQEIFDGMSDFIFVQDADYRFIKVNKAFADALKMKPDDLIGKRCYEVFHKSDKPWPTCPLSATLKDKKSHTEEVFDHPNVGIPLLVTTSPIMNDKGEVKAIVHVAQDISDQKRLEMLLQHLLKEQQMILDAVPAWIFYKDKENRFMRVNKAYAEAIGIPKDRIEGVSVFDMYPKEEAEKYWRDDKAVMESGKAKLNIIESADTRNGKVWVQTDKIPYRDSQGKIIGIVGFAIDITERKLAQEELDKKMRQLELINKAAIDRELKMVELKKRIEALERFIKEKETRA